MSPGRRTNRKNLRNCQRTILLYSFYFLSQRKVCNFIYFIFNGVQVVHRRVTGFCAGSGSNFAQKLAGHGFRRARPDRRVTDGFLPSARACEYLVKALLGRGFARIEFWWSASVSLEIRRVSLDTSRQGLIP